jgi:ferredoxin-NADP reductase/DMSO/TMAO reductase YedYZ heme-binding membrane subunit/ferredoxin
MFDVPFLKRLVILNGLVPLSILAWDAWRGQLGANSVNYAIHVTGIIALLFLVFSLAITPLKAATGWNTLIAYRRALGLYGFFYAVVHMFLYVVFDRAGNLSSTWAELISRRYLQVGLLSVILMIPLAVTSTDTMIRKLGPKRWKLLHRLTYFAIALGGLHYLLLVKADIRQPVAFLGVIGTLVVSRFGLGRWDRSLRRQPPRRMVPASIQPRVAASSASPKFWKGNLKLAKIFTETPDVKTFRFVDPEGGRLPFEFQPGQYLNLKLKIDGSQVNRSYTIASSPTRRDYCEITVKREPNGTASKFIHDTWRENDLIEIGAPAGKFFFTGKSTDEVILIAGGVGITPVMSMLRFLTDRCWAGAVHFIFVAKTHQDFIFREELEYLNKRFPNLGLHITFTRAEPNDEVYKFFSAGRLTAERLAEWIPNLATLPVYMCGPDPMMEDTRRLLLEAGVLENAIHTEAFSTKPTSPVGESLRDELGQDGAEAKSAENARAAMSYSATDGAEFSLRVQGSATDIKLLADESILEGAERCGIEIPFECRSGVCGQCKVRLCAGKVRMDSTYALSAAEAKAGWILACQAHLDTDAEIKIS